MALPILISHGDDANDRIKHLEKMCFFVPTACTICCDQASERGEMILPLILGVMILPVILGVILLYRRYRRVVPSYEADNRRCQQKLIQCGGWRHPPLTFANVQPYLREDAELSLGAHMTFSVVDHVSRTSHQQYSTVDHHLYVDIPLDILMQFVPVATARKIANLHGINVGSHDSSTTLKQLFEVHVCGSCAILTTVLSIHDMTPQNNRKDGTVKPDPSHIQPDDFPPSPVSQIQSHQIIQSACMSMDKRFIEEGGCAVCGQLTCLTELSQLSAIRNLLEVLAVPGITRQERRTDADRVKDLPLAIDNACDKVCLSCRAALRKSRMPKYALARGIWIGTVPEELSCLRYIERMLVARVRHSCCCVRIASGMRKMKSNAVAFRTPIPKI